MRPRVIILSPLSRLEPFYPFRYKNYTGSTAEKNVLEQTGGNLVPLWVASSPVTYIGDYFTTDAAANNLKGWFCCFPLMLKNNPRLNERTTQFYGCFNITVINLYVIKSVSSGDKERSYRLYLYSADNIIVMI
jgi:hypothetical protein